MPVMKEMFTSSDLSVLHKPDAKNRDVLTRDGTPLWELRACEIGYSVSVIARLITLFHHTNGSEKYIKIIRMNEQYVLDAVYLYTFSQYRLVLRLFLDCSQFYSL